MMGVKLSNTNKSKWNVETFLPVLLTSGPVFLWMGLQSGINIAFASELRGPNWLTMGVSTGGLFMLILGLAALLFKQRRLERRLEELERLNR